MIDWDISIALGIEEIDRQHRNIISLIQSIQNQEPHTTRTTNEILQILRAHIADHFEKEEAIMADINFPSLETHQREHELFINHVVFFEIEKKFGVNDEDIRDALATFLANWFYEHIATHDKEIGVFLREQAMKD